MPPKAKQAVRRAAKAKARALACDAPNHTAVGDTQAVSLREKLETHAESFMQIAQTCLLQDGHVETIVFTMGADDCINQIIAPQTDSARLAVLLRKEAQTSKAVGMVAEVWNLSRHIQPQGLRPSEHPQSTEGIVVSMQSRAGSWLLTSSFTRDSHGKPTRPTTFTAEWSEGVGSTADAHLQSLYA